MTIVDIFHTLVRWAHFVSSAAWIGGGIFWLLVLKPALNKDAPRQVDSKLNPLAAIEFKSVVDTCLFVLIGTGALMTFDRLSQDAMGVLYVSILGVKIILVAIMFLLARGRRSRFTLSMDKDRPNPTPNKSTLVRTLRLISGYNLIVLLGIIVFLISDVLRTLYEVSIR